MSEVTLKFVLPDEEYDFESALKSKDFRKYLWDLSQWLRDRLKHGHNFESANEVIDYLRTELLEFSNEHGLSLP